MKKSSEYSVAPVTHIIGKDILRFHAVYWPAMLMSAGLPLPKKVFGHGFLTKDGMKMGKTLGNVVDPVELTEEFGSDSVRFFFMREFPFGRDGDYSRQAMINRLNTDLANNLGNLLNRSTNLMRKYFANSALENLVEKSQNLVSSSGSNLARLINDFTNEFKSDMNDINIFQALDSVFDCLSEANAEMSNIAPWTLLKNASEEDTETIQKAFDCLYLNLEACRRAAICLAALTPNLSKDIFSQLAIINEDTDISNRYSLLETEFSFSKLGNILSVDNLANILSSKSKPVFERIADKEAV